MEQVVTIDLWSDNWKAQEIINILHDIGIKTAGMHTEINGTFEEGVEWSRCKDGEIPSLCVSLTGDAMKSIAENVHETKDVEEKPLFLYKVNIIDDVPDKAPEEEEEKASETSKEEAEMRVTAIMNIGCSTKNGVAMDVESMVNEIGYYTDCTITKCVGFYKGQRENSLKVEIYDTAVDNAVNLASYFARIFTQECVALTIKGKTHFITGDMSDSDFFDVVIDFEKE